MLQRICDALQAGTIERVLPALAVAAAVAARTTRTGRPGTGGSCRWPRSRCPGPSCSPSPGTPAPSSMPWSPTTSTLGLPDVIEMIFDRPPPAPAASCGTGSSVKTKVVTRGTEVTINAFWKHSRIKQYLKDGRALRIETVMNAPMTSAASAACTTWTSFRPGHVRSTPGCCTLNVPARAASLRIQSSSGSRTPPSMRRGGELQPCALATLGSRPWPAPVRHPGAVTGITNRSLRALMTGLLGAPYSMTQASYDLARLGRNGLITRRPHANTYDLTPTAWPSRSSTPRSTTASWPRCSPPGSLRRHPSCVPPSAPSNTTSTNASPMPGCPPQPEELSSSVGVVAPKGR